MQTQTYRVTLSDGRTFDVTTEGGPPDEDTILSGLQNPPAVPEPAPVSEHPHARVGRAGVEALKAGAGFAWRASGIPGFMREGPIGAIKDQGGIVRDVLQSHWDQARKAVAAGREGRYAEAAGHTGAAVLPVAGPMAAHVGEQIAAGNVPELVGELGAAVVTGGAGPMAGGARAGLQARRTAGAARSMARAEGDLLMAVPATNAAKYTPADFRTAKPYLNEQHRKTPIATTEGLRDALDNSIGEIEGRISGFTEAFPEARLHVGEPVARAIADAFAGNPRGKALEAGLRELEDLPLSRDLTLPELDAVRGQLNAENRAILKRNSYDQATARKADPGFAAREAAARAIRDSLYDYLESRGVQGVRDLRRDEGALIKLRDATNRQVFSGQKAAPGAKGSTARQVLGEIIDRATPLPHAVVEPVAKLVKGSRPTRDDLIARVFEAADDRLPTYPEVPARRPVRGALPPKPEPMPASGQSPSGDASGPIKPTLPENYVREQAALDEITGPARQAVAAVPEERAFIARWLADDLREISYQPAARMRGVAANDEFAGRAYGEKATNYAPRVAGTHTQEMFHALGIKGTRSEIADRLDTFVRTGKGSPKIEALADAMREAWDGQRFDFDLVSDATMHRLGIRRRDLRDPSSLPNPDDMPSVYDKFFRSDAADDFDFEGQ